MNRQNPPSNHDRAGRAGDEGQWTCVATAPDQLVAEMWQQLLREDSIPSMLAPQDAVSFLGLSAFPVRLLVPAALSHRAEAALAEALGGGPASPESEDEQ